MFGLTTSHRFLLYGKVVDFRKGFDGLCGLVRNELARDPLSGEVFIFMNRPRTRLKLLQWQHGGFVLYYKRLEKGTFSFPISANKDSASGISYSEMVLMIEGIKVEKWIEKPRYKIL
ncbi:MAG: IS66 family insertion sequence element accessory protein TnpB [Cyclobacteriaceae bacterium]|nr:IS66 family insertion sequence element accessory protein TnpB [Cyclobacteriaceae bacterium]